MRSSQHVLLFLLSLLSVGRSAPVSDCESLTRPLEFQRDQLLGKWNYVARSTNIPGADLVTKDTLDTAWMNFEPIEDKGVKVFITFKMFGLCFSKTYNYTIENNTMSTEKIPGLTGVLLPTSCPDCIVQCFNITVGTNTWSTLQLNSRRSQVTSAEMDEFNKQVKCLNLFPPATPDSDKVACPESKTVDTTLQNMDKEIFKRFENYMKREDVTETLHKMLEIIDEFIPNEHK